MKAVKLLFVAAAMLASSVSALTDIDILNFALNLEYLEGQFYSCAVYGRPLGANIVGSKTGKIIGCQKALLSPEYFAYAQEIASDEAAHVKFLRGALGKDAVCQPDLDLGPAWAAAANAALNTTLSPPFTPYGSDILFLHGAFALEDVGVTAYKGAAQYIANKDYLTAAAGILAVEAYHAGAIRSLLIERRDEYVFPYNAQVKTIIGAISALRASVSADHNDDQGIVYGGKTNFVPTDNNGIVFSRSVSDVVNIVTLGNAKTGKGGFFPSGLSTTTC